MYVAFAAAGVLAASALAAASDPLAAGPQFQVNTYTPESQVRAAVSLAADGDFVIVWSSYGSSEGDTSGYSIQGQRYSAAGGALAGQFQVNSFTPNAQYGAAVSLDADGDFAVVWNSFGSDGSDSSSSSVQGRRFDSEGGVLGEQFQVNTYTASHQFAPAVSLDADGDFVVVWASDGSSDTDQSSFSIQGQRFAAEGGGQGGEFQVNSYTTNLQYAARVSLDASGDFTVVWASDGSGEGDTSSFSAQGQLHSADGGAQDAQFQVNALTTDAQILPDVATNADGDFVVVWMSAGSIGDDTSSFSIQGQRYAAGGAPQGGQFQVNSYTDGYQGAPAVAVDSDGDFVVVWHSAGSAGSDTSSSSIQGQRFAAGGEALEEQFQVNSYTTNLQTFPAVSVDPDGDFVVAWDSYGSSGTDASSYSIQGQRFRVTGDLVGKVFFDDDADGLQSGAEPGVGGVVVELYDDTLALRRTAVSDELGEYRLRPKAGNWHLRFVAPPGFFTLPDVGGDDTIDSDAIPATGETAPFSVNVNVLDATVDAGFVVPLIFWDGFESGDMDVWSSCSLDPYPCPPGTPPG